MRGADSSGDDALILSTLQPTEIVLFRLICCGHINRRILLKSKLSMK